MGPIGGCEKNMKTFREKLEKDIMLLDGAFGTYIQSLGLNDSDFKDRQGCMEYLSLTVPALVEKAHSGYLDAGSDAVETNTFGANALKLAEYGLEEEVHKINLESARIARRAADSFSAKDHPRYVVGTMGPTGKLPSSTDPSLGDVSYQELKDIFFQQAGALIDGGVDAILVETGQDLLEMKAALNGAKKAISEKGRDIVTIAQCTLANSGRMLLGTDISAVMTTLAYLGADVIGMNCSTGPVEMEGAVAYLSDNASTYISCLPNAGLPVEVSGETVYPMGPGDMAGIMASFVKKYGIDIIGGCCGTTPEHIKAIRENVKHAKKRKKTGGRFYSSYYKAFSLDDMERPIKVGERINTQGSRRTKNMLLDEDYDGILDLGRLQVKAGADVLDVCSVLTERNTEKRDSLIIVRNLAESVQVPLMIDSTDVEVIKSSLESYPGTAFINSVNLEDGGEKARKIFALAREHGGYIVNLVIDPRGMAKKVKDKLGIAAELYRIAREEYSIEPHRLIFDMLTFSLGTGEEEYADSAVNTYEAIKKVKKQCPGVLTVSGVSNVSFGLGKEARKVINMVYLHHAVQAGLDLAIVNPSEYIQYDDIPEKDRGLAEDLVFNRGKEALSRVIDHFADKAAEAPGAGQEREDSLSMEDKLKRCILERDKVRVISLIDEALKDIPAERIVNEILMEGMREVGEKLDRGEMVLPYVLQSAEVMRKAIEYLSGYLHGEAAGKKGKVLLATVFGDVHDIGKNLVKMILQNNGFTVIDLGKQVPIETIIEEARRNNVDAVGLSALLVSTSKHMKTCVQSLSDAGLEYPVIVGGAPINENFAKDISLTRDKSLYKGGVFYSKDAFTGLKLMRSLMDVTARKEIMGRYFENRSAPGEKRKVPDEQASSLPAAASRRAEVPLAPFIGVRHLSNIPVDEVFSYLNEDMLFGLAWGANLKDAKEKERVIKDEYRPLLAELKEEAVKKNWLDLKAVYGYFVCRKEGNDILVLDEERKELERIHFQRSNDGASLTVADYFREEDDVVAFQAVTVGKRFSEAIKELDEAKDVTRAYFVHGLSVHLAEAVAAYVHDIIRKELGLKKGQGKRYSPGYPLWNDLRDQQKIFRILEVSERIGVELNEEYQMVPEQSTTAMVVHNDKAGY